ncbi:MAG: SGNH/GDSL hydrolase family protein [Atopobiaceae bacterium]
MDGKERILMLGNSFTRANGLPELLGKELSCEVEIHARGGARLAEQLNPKTKLGAQTLSALEAGGYAFVVLQEMSTAAVTSPASFERSAGRLAELVRAEGGVPILFETWAFNERCPRLAALGLTSSSMQDAITHVSRRIAEEHGLVLAEVGEVFRERGFAEALYARDGRHPSETGTRLAASILTSAIRGI